MNRLNEEKDNEEISHVIELWSTMKMRREWQKERETLSSEETSFCGIGIVLHGSVLLELPYL